MQFDHVTLKPKYDIVATARQRKTDILVVGAKGHSHTIAGHIKDKIHHVGAVADYCVHNADCSVIVVKQP